MDKVVAFSGCGCVIRADEVPVAGGATLEEALTSGEEAALVCAGPEALVLQAGLRPVAFPPPHQTLPVVGPPGHPRPPHQTPPPPLPPPPPPPPPPPTPPPPAPPHTP